MPIINDFTNFYEEIKPCYPKNDIRELSKTEDIGYKINKCMNKLISNVNNA